MVSCQGHGRECCAHLRYITCGCGEDHAYCIKDHHDQDKYNDDIELNEYSERDCKDYQKTLW